jgi:hypothetical protein
LFMGWDLTRLPKLFSNSWAQVIPSQSSECWDYRCTPPSLFFWINLYLYTGPFSIHMDPLTLVHHQPFWGKWHLKKRNCLHEKLSELILKFYDTCKIFQTAMKIHQWSVC